jgi:GT2 family glycosyltransferase
LSAPSHRPPTLADLPPPPLGRTGWPWTEASPPVAPRAGCWPSISVVIPSYQQAAFLEETIRSVLLQGYPSLEVLVMDAGSTDGSVDIIRRYEAWLAGWVSERDAGQSNAINKGWQRARGDLLTWLNSDDLLLPGWAAAMAGTMIDSPEVDLTYCDVQVIDAGSRPTWIFPGQPAATLERMVVYWMTSFAQQGFLMRRRVLETCGVLDEALHFAMDAEYWLRLLWRGRVLRHVPRTLAAYRMHAEAKTGNQHDVQMADLTRIVTHFCDTAAPELAPLAERARRRMRWNAAHTSYAAGRHAEARGHALAHLRDDGPRALPRVAGMVALSLLGARGHDLLALARRLRHARG